MKYEVPIQTKIENNILIIEGQAIDTTVNDRNWAIEEADIPDFIASLKDSVIQIRDAHRAISTEDIKGKVTEAWRDGNSVRFRAEILGDPALLQKILEGCITDSSPGIIGAEYICSVCRKPDRDETKTKIVHMCSGGHEIIRKPRWIEQSLVPKGAYANNKIRVVGFKAGQDLSFREALQNHQCTCTACTSCGISELAVANGIVTGIAQPNPSRRLNGQEQKMSTEQNTAQALDVKALAKSISEELAIDQKISAAILPLQEKLQAMQTPKLKAKPQGTGKIDEPETIGPFGAQVPDYLVELRVAASSKKVAAVAGAPIDDEEEDEEETE